MGTKALAAEWNALAEDALESTAKLLEAGRSAERSRSWLTEESSEGVRDRHVGAGDTRGKSGVAETRAGGEGGPGTAAPQEEEEEKEEDVEGTDIEGAPAAAASPAETHSFTGDGGEGGGRPEWRILLIVNILGRLVRMARRRLPPNGSHVRRVRNGTSECLLFRAVARGAELPSASSRNLSKDISCSFLHSNLS